MSQKFDGNIRTTKVFDDDELRDALKDGWDKELPAIKDEHGVLLVGHRRMKIAKELGIEPIIKTVTFGDGPEADAMRIRLANVSNIGSASLTKEDRQHQAELYYKSGMTMEAIGRLLGVSQKTISNDLETLVTVTNVKGQGKDTLGRTRSTGRPKGSRPKPASHAQVVVLADSGTAKRDIAAKTGLGERMVDRVLEVEQARREGQADPIIDRSELSMTAQQKLDAAIRQEKHRLALSFSNKVNDRVKEMIDEIILPHWKKQIAEAQELYARRKALMDKATFNIIRRALHPDSRNSISDQKLSEAFDAFMALEKYLLNEKDSPTPFHDVPDNLAAWDKAKQAATAARRARRAKGQASSLRRQ